MVFIYLNITFLGAIHCSHFSSLISSFRSLNECKRDFRNHFKEIRKYSKQLICEGRALSPKRDILPFVGNTLCVERIYSTLNRHLLKQHQIQANDPLFATLSTLNLRGLLLLPHLKLPKSSLVTPSKLYLRVVHWLRIRISELMLKMTLHISNKL